MILRELQKIFITILLLCLFHSLSASELQATQSPRYFALVIGNDIYRDPTQQWASLQTAVADAEAVHELLQDHFIFTDVNLLLNATRRDIIRALTNLSETLTEGDKVLIYYAGHGYFDENADVGYWVPVDAEGSDDSTFISNSVLRDKLNAITKKAQNTLLISDACFSGSLIRTNTRAFQRIVKPENIPAKEIPIRYQKFESKKSAQIITSGGMEYVDDDYRHSGHSPFTYFLLNELTERKDGLFSASELALNVQQRVADNVKQSPEAGIIQGVGHEGGEFVFRPTGFENTIAKVGRPGSIKIPRVKSSLGESNLDRYSMTVGANTWLTNWQIQNSENFLDGAKSDLGLFYGPNLKMHKGQWLAGINYFTGTLKFDSLEIKRTDGTINRNNMDVDRSELDLYLGYHFNEHFIGLMGYKNTTNDYQFIASSSSDNAFVNHFNETIHGISASVASFYPLTNTAFKLFARLGSAYHFANNEVKTTADAATKKDDWNSLGLTFDAGVTGRIANSDFYVLAALKTSYYQQQQSSSNKDTFLGAMLSVNYQAY